MGEDSEETVRQDRKKSGRPFCLLSSMMHRERVRESVCVCVIWRVEGLEV